MTKVVAFMIEPEVRHRVVARLGWVTMAAGALVTVLLAVLAFTG